MNEFYRQAIERYQSSYKVTTDEFGRMSIKYEPQQQSVENNYLDIMECAYQNMRSYSVIKAIYNAIFKKHPIEQEVPITLNFHQLSKYTQKQHG